MLEKILTGILATIIVAATAIGVILLGLAVLAVCALPLTLAIWFVAPWLFDIAPIAFYKIWVGTTLSFWIVNFLKGPSKKKAD